jgi:hypothetical protein
MVGRTSGNTSASSRGILPLNQAEATVRRLIQLAVSGTAAVRGYSSGHSVRIRPPHGSDLASRAICGILGRSAGKGAGHALTWSACRLADPLMGGLE